MKVKVEPRDFLFGMSLNILLLQGEHPHQVCQMPNFWHLAHQTPISMLYEMFQISNFFATCYNAVSFMELHCSMLQIFLLFVYSKGDTVGFKCFSVGFFNIILIFIYIILMYRIEEYKM